MEGLNKGVVKAVRSGDTIIVMGAPVRGPPPEKEITFSGVVAPRLGNAAKDVKDEPFAWASREFLRSNLIGKQVQFRIDGTHPTTGRCFGSVYIAGPQGMECVTDILLRNGFVKMKDTERELTAEQVEMAALQSKAEEEGRGMWIKEEGVSAKAVRPIPDEIEPAELLKDVKGKQVPAIIEYFRDGSTFRAVLLPTFRNILVHLAGIKCPGYARNDDGHDVAQPHADEAKYFIESRLLHREVRLELTGLDKMNGFFGSIISPAGDISKELVRVGLAKVVDWSISFVSPQKAVDLRGADKVAKAQRLRIWKDYVPPVSSVKEDDKAFTAKVSEVISGDLLVVQREGVQKKDMKLSLASIRAPRMGNAKKGEKDQPFAFEAKEFVRSRLIGKKVDINVDYVRKVGEDDRPFATITLKDKNVAEDLVKMGYASVIRHRMDEERSIAYEALMAAETTAQAQKKNLHKTGDLPVHRINDVAQGGVAKAKQVLSFLQKEREVEAIVDFVLSSTRVKVYVPKENCMVVVAMAGVQCPSGPRGDSKGDPFGAEALAFAKDKLHQRDVTIEFDQVDKSGAFIGTVYVNKKNFAVTLAAEGFAKLRPYYDKLPYAAELESAVEEAKASKRKIWENYVEEKPAEKEEQVVEEYVKVEVTEVVDGVTFYATRKGDKALEWLAEQMKAWNLDSASLTPQRPQKGQVVLAKFSDGTYYRAKVEDVKGGRAFVTFIDYGNQAEVASEDVKALDSASLRVPGLARMCKLAFLRLAEEDDDLLVEAGTYLSRSTFEKVMMAKVVGKEGNALLVDLYTPDGTVRYGPIVHPPSPLFFARANSAIASTKN
uniref:Uncharacterized protein n=1 Tax=Palpitomonas bilix TaxID=652834 RepID=A0A7S3GBZ8_9EUKA|mmetsp:Transcript_39520/g.101443  ORF Transcript_39520/g.101443 Transcript_39520/m.101443 type:complete len:831 (+) Transcript_39520:48-2540(+)